MSQYMCFRLNPVVRQTPSLLLLPEPHSLQATWQWTSWALQGRAPPSRLALGGRFQGFSSRPTPPIVTPLGPQAMFLLKAWNPIELGQGAYEFHLPKPPKDYPRNRTPWPLPLRPSAWGLNSWWMGMGQTVMDFLGSLQLFFGSDLLLAVTCPREQKGWGQPFSPVLAAEPPSPKPRLG